MSLNVVYFGQQQFPNGPATSKRRRYMVDYMNMNNITNHVLVTFYPNSPHNNEKSGLYGKTDYIDIKHLFPKKISRYYNEGKKALKKWYRREYKNIIIFPTVMNFMDYPFYRYAKKLGYHIVFDQVETSYLKSNKLGWKSYIYFWLNEKVSKIAYKHSSSFVISSKLMDDNRKAYPHMKLCLLPNSTPILSRESRIFITSPLKIFYSGTYGEKEGVNFLIDGVIKALDKGISCNITLSGKAPQNLINKYCSHRYSSRITFKGFVSDEELNKLLLDSDVLAMVRTNTEFANYGFPFKLSEYLATGNIVIATKVGDVEDYLTDGVNAYLINPEDSDAVFNVIESIYKDSETACSIACNGLKTAKEKFDIEHVGKIFEIFLKSL
jgi:glycosyltransferase involved in cell wall biosynthesis